MHDQIDVKEDKREDPRVAEFAILCRSVRLFIAKNPGSTMTQIKQQFGGSRCQMAIGKMVNMEIIRSEWKLEDDGRRVTRWYVIPQ